MENVMLEKSKGATYMSFLLDVEIIIKKDGVSANLAESKMKSEAQDTKNVDKESKRKGPKGNKTEQVTAKKEGEGKKEGEVKVYTAELSQRDVFKKIADEGPSEKVLTKKQSKQSETNTCLDNVSNIIPDYKSHATLKGGKKKKKADQTAKAFKGKVEQIDFWECNRIFLCNRLGIANKRRFTKKFYSEKRKGGTITRTVSNTHVLSSQLSDKSNPFPPGTMYQQIEWRSLPNIDETIRTTQSFASLNSSQNAIALFKPPVVFIESNLGDSFNSERVESVPGDHLCFNNLTIDTRYNRLSDVETGKFENHKRDASFNKLFNKNNFLCYKNVLSQKPKYFKIFTTKLQNSLSKSRKRRIDNSVGGPRSTKVVSSWPILSLQDNYLKRFESCPTLIFSSTNILTEDEINKKEKQVKCHKNTRSQHSIHIDLVSITLTNGTKQEEESKTNDLKRQTKKHSKRKLRNMITCMLPGKMF